MPRLPFIVLIFLCAHWLSYFFRSTNAVLAEEFRRDIGLGPEQLGLMTSLFLASYTAVQLPLGSALDRWGPRWVVAGMILLFAVSGSLVIASASNLLELAVGRALIGVGMAGSLMGALKALSSWLPPRAFTIASSAFIGAGSLGALAATSPLVWASATFGWRQVFVFTAIAAGVVALLLPVIVRAKPRAQRGEGPRAQRGEGPRAPEAAAGPAEAKLVVPEANGAEARAGNGPRAPERSAVPDPSAQGQGFAAIFGDPHFRRLALTIFTLSGVMFAYQGLWGGPLLVQGLGRDVGQAGRALLLLAVCNSLGFFAAGLLGRRYGIPRVIITGALLAASVLVVLLNAQPSWPTWTLYLLYALLGAGTSAGVLGYAQAREFFPHMAGRAVTAINFAGLGGGAVLQVALGAVVALAVSLLGAAEGGPPLAAHRWAMAVSLALVLLGIVAYRPLLAGRAAR